MQLFKGLFLGVCVLATVAAGMDARAASAQTHSAEDALGQIRPSGIRAHMAFLADDLLEGRGTGSRGFMIGAKYVAAQFQALGLEPAGGDGSYLQRVPFRRAEMLREGSSLILRRGGESTTLAHGEDLVLGGDFLREETSVEAPVVFVGFGVTAPEREYDDFEGLEVEGKIVASLIGAPPSFPSSQRAYYSEQAVKTENAVSHGAVGLLYLWTPEMEKRFPLPVVVRLSSRGCLLWLDQDGVPHGPFPEIRGGALLSRSKAEELFIGAERDYEEVLRRSKSGEPLGLALDVTARMEVRTGHTALSCANVVALLKGSDPALSREYVVYSAHLDHDGIGEAIDGDAIYNGALDNASGVAALLEIARAFASLEPPPRRSIVFVATTAEEKGLLGADYFANRPTVPVEKIVANVNMDGMGMFFPARDIVAHGAEHSSLGGFVQQAADRLGFTVSPDPSPEETFFIRSDQYPFIKQGIPALFLFPGFQSADPEVDGAAFLQRWLTTIYHSPKDDMSQDFDFDEAARVTKMNFLVGHLAANTEQPPSWNPGDFFGERFGRP